MKWISVKERFPDCYQRVLCHRPDKFLVICKAIVGTKKCSFINAETGRPVEEVTHWMPLPEYPNI